MIGGVRVKATEGFAVLFVVAEKGLGAIGILLYETFLTMFPCEVFEEWGNFKNI